MFVNKGVKNFGKAERIQRKWRRNRLICCNVSAPSSAVFLNSGNSRDSASSLSILRKDHEQTKPTKDRWAMGTDYDVIFHDGLPLYRQEKMQGPHLQKVLYGYVEMALRTSLSYWLIMSRGLPTVFYLSSKAIWCVMAPRALINWLNETNWCSYTVMITLTTALLRYWRSVTRKANWRSRKTGSQRRPSTTTNNITKSSVTPRHWMTMNVIKYVNGKPYPCGANFGHRSPPSRDALKYLLRIRWVCKRIAPMVTCRSVIFSPSTLQRRLLWRVKTFSSPTPQLGLVRVRWFIAH